MRRGRRDRHPILHPPQIAARVRVIRHDDVQHLQHIRHRPRVRHHHIHRRHQGPVAAHRDHPPRRRIGTKPVVGRRCPPRGPRFLRQTKGGKARCCRTPRSVGRARGKGRGEPIGRIGTFRPPIKPALHATIGHRRHIGQPDQHRPRRPQLGNRKGIIRGHQIGKGGRACGCGKPPHLIAGLGGIGDAVQRPQNRPGLAARVRRTGVSLGRGVQDRYRVQTRPRAVIARDPVQIGAQQPKAGVPPRLQSRAQIGDACLDNRHLVFRAGCCCVMQCTPPPRANNSRASTVTTRRPG